MAMLCSYNTLLSRAPAPALAKSSLAGAVQFRSRQPAAAASVAALRWAPCNKSRSRAALFACHANNDKDTPDIVDDEDGSEFCQVPAKVPAKPSIWDVMVTAQKDHIILKLRVGESPTSKEKLKLTTTEDQTRLVIRYIGDNSPAASGLNFELTIPPGYDGKTAQGWLLANGWLIITIAKKPKNEVNVDISRDKPQSSSEPRLPPAPAPTPASPERQSSPE